MKYTSPLNHDWMDARVEAYLDGELPADEEADFARFLAGDPAWEVEVHRALQIRTGLRTLPMPTCPPAVAQAVLAEVGRQRMPRGDRFRAWLEHQWMELWQPALAMTVLLMIVVSAALIGRPTPPAAQDPEVARAVAEVQWTLAYLSDIGRRAGQAVEQDVLQARVVAPVRQAFGLQPFTPPEDLNR